MLFASCRSHTGVQHANVRCSVFDVRCSMFQLATYYYPFTPNIFQRANKRAAFCRQRERNDDHFASVRRKIIEIFSAELVAAISPLTSFTSGRGKRALLNSAALFAGIST